MGSRVCWADLLPELVARIVDRFEDRADIHRFRAVCRSWRSCCHLLPNLISLHIPPKTPAISVPFKPDSKPPELAIFSCSIYLLLPCQDQASTTHPVPRLFRFQELNPGKFILRSALKSHHLPKPNAIDPSRFRVVQLARTYHLTRRRLSYVANHKVLLLSNPRSDDISSLVLSGNGNVYAIRSRQEAWQPVIIEGASWIDDILLYKGVVYAVDNRGCLYRLSKTLLATLVSVPLQGHHYPETRKRLVELNEELYLVREINCKLQVYKLNEKRCSWCTIGSFGERVLFVGIDCCFFVPAEVFPSWKGNGIVFHFGAFQLHMGRRFPDLSWEDFRGQFLTCKPVYYTGLGDQTYEPISVDENVLLSPPVPQSRSSDEE